MPNLCLPTKAIAIGKSQSVAHDTDAALRGTPLPTAVEIELCAVLPHRAAAVSLPCATWKPGFLADCERVSRVNGEVIV